LAEERTAEERQEPVRPEGASVCSDARISVYPMGDDHPLAHLFGKYADDPMWQELEAIIDRNRVSDNANGDIE
jgi:hypothetical protein